MTLFKQKRRPRAWLKLYAVRHSAFHIESTILMRHAAICRLQTLFLARTFAALMRRTFTHDAITVRDEARMQASRHAHYYFIFAMPRLQAICFCMPRRRKPHASLATIISPILMWPPQDIHLFSKMTTLERKAAGATM